MATGLVRLYPDDGDGRWTGSIGVSGAHEGTSTYWEDWPDAILYLLAGSCSWPGLVGTAMRIARYCFVARHPGRTAMRPALAPWALGCHRPNGWAAHKKATTSYSCGYGNVEVCSQRDRAAGGGKQLAGRWVERPAAREKEVEE